MRLLTDPWFEAKFYASVTSAGFRTQREDGTPFSIDEAQGVMLWCPCGYGQPEYSLDGGRPHAILVPFANPRSGVAVPADHGPVSRNGTHPRWTMSGTSLVDLSCTPSIAVGDPECWHGYITNGEVR